MLTTQTIYNYCFLMLILYERIGHRHDMMSGGSGQHPDERVMTMCNRQTVQYSLVPDVPCLRCWQCDVPRVWPVSHDPPCHCPRCARYCHKYCHPSSRLKTQWCLFFTKSLSHLSSSLRIPLSVSSCISQLLFGKYQVIVWAEVLLDDVVASN